MSANSIDVNLPEDLFGVQTNIPLIHQVVVAQLSAARQGSHDTKTRGEVAGGGKKPYRQKGTGRARQGSIRAPQYTGGGVVHGPSPRQHGQHTPKKRKSDALRGDLSDRARDGRIHVVESIDDVSVPSTRSSLATISAVTDRRRVLVVVDGDDQVSVKSLRNVPDIVVLRHDQVNTYGVIVSDDVVVSKAAFDASVAARAAAGGAGGGG